VVHQRPGEERLDCFGDGSVTRAAHRLFRASVYLRSPAPNRRLGSFGEPEVGTSERVLVGRWC
jgi:hypothetical protein